MNAQDRYMLRLAALDNLTPGQEAYRQAITDQYHAMSLYRQHGQDDMGRALCAAMDGAMAAFSRLSTSELPPFRIRESERE